MNYLDIENGKVQGWTIPMYPTSAEKFAEEVKKVCVAGSSGTGIADTSDGKIKLYHTNYMFKDGTRFILTYDEDDDLVEIEAKDTYVDDFETVYYNNYYRY
jgi:hypothetical protein